jgi:hypothetical protein
MRSLRSLGSQVHQRERRDSFASYEGFVMDHKEDMLASSPSPEPDFAQQHDAATASLGGFPFSPVGGMDERTRDGEYRLDLESGLATPLSARMKPPPSPAEPPVYR